ncbi:MAG: hydrogenase maturation nickel metallochaperone HypA [Bacteroidales bacterium]|nr:hydrogenase maturation nickel metallochaperone HypA [Bacteroidales bacterium]
MNISLQVAEQNNISRISAVNLDVGEMQHLNEQILQHGFDASVKDTIMSRADLKLRWVPVKLKCRDCYHIFEPQNGCYYCPQCKSKDTEIKQGMELTINSIEGE